MSCLAVMKMLSGPDSTTSSELRETAVRKVHSQYLYLHRLDWVCKGSQPLSQEALDTQQCRKFTASPENLVEPRRSRGVKFNAKPKPSYPNHLRSKHRS